MNDLETQDLIEKITLALLSGKNPGAVQKEFSCDSSLILRIMGDNSFSERIRECLEKDIQINGLAAIRNIRMIANEVGISKATQLKANQWLAEKALEFNRLGVGTDSPATMSQDQLARRLKELQQEAVKRAKPIDTGVIDLESMT